MDKIYISQSICLENSDQIQAFAHPKISMKIIKNPYIHEISQLRIKRKELILQISNVHISANGLIINFNIVYSAANIFKFKL
jgi:hypothetical protein